MAPLPFSSSPPAAPAEGSSVSRRKLLVASAITLLVPATLYLLTLYPGVGGRVNAGDSAKFQYIGEILGVPHQPGYPQYVILNYLWTRLPLPMPLADQVNLLSAVLSLVAGLFLFLSLTALTRNLAASVLGTWAVLLGRSVWTFSTEAEVYALNLLWLALVLWVVSRWWEHRDRKWLVALIWLYGFSFGNHPTMITLLPGLLVLPSALAWRELIRPRMLGTALLVAVLSLSQYGFLVWRAHSDTPVLEGIKREAGLSDLASTMSGRRFTEQNLFSRGWPEFSSRLARMPLETIVQVSAVTALLAPLGLLTLARGAPPLGLFLTLGILSPCVFAGAYQIGDWESYLAPAWIMVAALAAIGVARGLDGARRRALLLGVWAAAIGLMASYNFRVLRLETDRYDVGPLLEAVPPGARVVTYRGPGYRAAQMNRYYRFGLRLEEERGLDLLTAVQAFEERFSFLEDRPIYFRDQRVRAFFDDHHVDYVSKWLTDDPDSYCFVTATRYPVDSLELTPSPGGGIEVRRLNELLISPAEDTLQIVVASPRDRRIKGFRAFPLDAPGPVGGVAAALDFLARVLDHDWACVVVYSPRLAERREQIEPIARLFGSAGQLADGPSSVFVVAGLKRDWAATAETLIDPVQPISLRIGPPDGPYR